VLDRTNKLQIDRFLPEPFSQNVAGVGSQPFTRLRRVGDIHLDQCQHVSVNNAEERATVEAPREFIRRVQKLVVLDRRAMAYGVRVIIASLPAPTPYTGLARILAY
jgi:hypothetical protein